MGPGNRGSEWRKWDLHVHVPGTTLNNKYTTLDGKVDVDRFCREIHASDVSAIGLTDYFCFDNIFLVKNRYAELLAEGELKGPAKLFLPNLELRLNEAVNKSGELIDYHLIFNSDLTETTAKEFLSHLKTSSTSPTGKPLSCFELSAGDFETATVTRGAIKSAIDDTYGPKADHRDYLFLIAPVNGNGVRADSGNQRKRLLSDEADKFSDGFFGNKSNCEHFLSSDRYDKPDQKSAAKPVFAGSDCHSFEEISSWLGKEISGTKNDKNITWIKADLTFGGFQQAFIEPSERVRMQADVPDYKEVYRRIASLTFSSTRDFPAKIDLNPNLNAVIGSRSSGKSALLAHAAYAVDPKYTMDQQLATGTPESDLGPAAGFLWSKMGDLKCSVVWADGSSGPGKVIYVPQNSLFSISSRPEEITAKIAPAVFKKYPEMEQKFRQSLRVIGDSNESIRKNVDAWFSQNEAINQLKVQLREKGERSAISAIIAELQAEVDLLQREAKLSPEESAQFAKITDGIRIMEDDLAAIRLQHEFLSSFIKQESGKITVDSSVRATVAVSPSLATFPDALKGKVEDLVVRMEAATSAKLHDLLTAAWTANNDAIETAIDEISAVKVNNAELIARHKKASGMSGPLGRLHEQTAILREVSLLEEDIEKWELARAASIVGLETAIRERASEISRVCNDFNGANVGFDGIAFQLEAGLTSETLNLASRDLNKQTETSYVDRANQCVRLEKIREDPSGFLTSLAEGAQRLNRNAAVSNVAHLVMEAVEDLRFVAVMDGDRVGGFERSSMTPGKQALFSLRLILGESDDKWPLFLDQPEDDLDSRSIYDVIVEELKHRKRERQIVMVTHDANLVVGADAEAVIVANRHGSDRPNRDGRTFDYVTGSLENSHRSPNALTTLSRAGIREHACDILDGGEAAFEKRRAKYKI